MIVRARAWTAWIAAASLVAACSDGGSAAADGDGDGEVVERDGDGDGVDGDAQDGEGDGGPAPIAPEREPELVALAEWMLGSVPADGPDPVRDAIEAGTLAYPAEGTDADGIRWVRRAPGANGSLGRWSGDVTIYAVARVSVGSGERLIARTGRTRGVYGDGALQPGDVYASRRMRVPVRSHEGENLVVVEGFPNYGAIEAELFRTPDEAVLNLDDLTVPDFVAGEVGDLYVGVPLLNLGDAPAFEVEARVVGNDSFEETSVVWPAIAAGAVTQVGFLLRPVVPFATPGSATARLHVESPSFGWAYERDVAVGVVASDAVRRRTFLSPDDGSVQYYAVLPPSSFDPGRAYALVLTLHGAGVEASGLAAAYSPKDWAYVVAPTNRRPFGFDWEEWGRANALFALDDAMRAFRVDSTRVYLTGHSMGGHGTWHVGVTTPGRFATIGPSAGWGSFYSYTGAARPTGAFARARAHSDTLVYLGNLARRGVYIIHGSADDNVPVREGRDMYAAVQAVTDDVVYHEEPGAGHWWDGDVSPGTDCVDWPPLFDFMQARTLDPFETDFEFTTPSPAYSAVHSYVTVQSAVTPFEDLVVASARSGDTVNLTTANVRSLEIDGAALRVLGVVVVVVDGTRYDVPGEPLFVGPRTGKRREAHGTFNQVFHRPFCFVHPDSGGGGLEEAFAAFMTSYWTIYGNGHACSVPLGRLTDGLRSGRNLVYVGLSAADLGDPDVAFAWDEAGVHVGDADFPGANLLAVFPEGDGLSAVLATPAAHRWDLWNIVPFSSRSGFPDYLVWGDGRTLAAGFFDADWRYDPTLRAP